MRNRDWTLVFFTVLSQLSVGVIVCITWLVSFGNDSRFLNLLGSQLKNPVLLALVSVGLATCISLLHLGNPKNAPRSLNNLAGSWVSREILALAIYLVSLLIVFVLGWNDLGFESLRYLLMMSSVFGGLFLWMMIRIYMIPTIPPWNSWYTWLSYISTAICLGTMTMLLLHYSMFVRAGCMTCYEQFIDDQATRMLMVSLSLVLLVEIFSGFFHQSRLVRMNTGIEAPVFDRGVFYLVFLSRMVMVALALLLLILLFLEPTRSAGDGSRVWVYLLTALTVVQALIGRLLFFSSYFRLGV